MMLCFKVIEVIAAKTKGIKNNIIEYLIGIFLKLKSFSMNIFKTKEIAVNPNNSTTYLKEIGGSVITVKYSPNSGLYNTSITQ